MFLRLQSEVETAVFLKKNSLTFVEQLPFLCVVDFAMNFTKIPWNYCNGAYFSKDS